MKVYIAGGKLYLEYIDWLKDAVQTSNIEEADLVLFAGGEDVHPSIYEEPVGSFTASNIHRDMSEIQVYEKPMLGICRGSQFLCVMSGGRLVQHQENKFHYHPIITHDGLELLISSTHHQAQYPYDMKKDEYQLIGWTENISRFHLDGENKEISDKPFKEAEIVYYPKINALGIQGHPEYMSRGNAEHRDTLEYLDNLVNNLLNKTF